MCDGGQLSNRSTRHLKQHSSSFLLPNPTQTLVNGTSFQILHAKKRKKNKRKRTLSNAACRQYTDLGIMMNPN